MNMVCNYGPFLSLRGIELATILWCNSHPGAKSSYVMEGESYNVMIAPDEFQQIANEFSVCSYDHLLQCAYWSVYGKREVADDRPAEDVGDDDKL
jgi:hypothetical protein